MITGQILEENGVLNLSCYPDNLPIGTVACEGNGNSSFNRLQWATPETTNGLTITGFQFAPAVDDTPPTADSFKTVLVMSPDRLGTYKRVVIPDDYTIADLVALCCAGCDPIPDVDVPDPSIPGWVVCQTDAVVCPPCEYVMVLDVPALTGGNTTFTATPVGKDADGVDITFSPTTVSAATLALLAAAAQTAWATELGSGTFVASGTTLTVEGSDISELAITVTQS